MTAVVMPLVAEPLAGDPGATVGALVGSVLFVALAAAVWPYEWSAEEHDHYRLEAIWREIRTDADDQVAWERFGAWAEADEDAVELMLMSCAPAGSRIAGAPSPYRLELADRVTADDIARATQVMERLRSRASERELEARQHCDHARHDAERREHEDRLRAIDETAAAEQAVRDAELRAEFAAQEAAERRAQAEAIARALRRP